MYKVSTLGQLDYCNSFEGKMSMHNRDAGHSTWKYRYYLYYIPCHTIDTLLTEVKSDLYYYHS